VIALGEIEKEKDRFSEGAPAAAVERCEVCGMGATRTVRLEGRERPLCGMAECEARIRGK
jgi:hypothetical protein